MKLSIRFPWWRRDVGIGGLIERAYLRCREAGRTPDVLEIGRLDERDLIVWLANHSPDALNMEFRPGDRLLGMEVRRVDADRALRVVAKEATA